MTNAIYGIGRPMLRRAICAVVREVLGSLALTRSSTGLARWVRLLVTTCVLLAVVSAMVAMPAAATDTAITFSVSNGVSTEDASYVTEGLALAQSYVAETLSALSAPLTVNVRGTDDGTGGGAVAFYGDSYIVIFTGSPGWIALAPFDRVRVVVHEYIHAWQHAVLGDQAAMLPAWFIEGMADYLAYDAVAALGLVEIQAVRDYHAWSVTAAPGLPPLSELRQRDAFYNEHGPVYSLAWLAVDSLMVSRAHAEIVRVLEGIRLGQSWRSAFAAVFDQRVDEFYPAFEQNRSRMIAPVRPPDSFKYALPAQIDAAVTIDTVTQSVRAGDQMVVLARSEPGAICAFELTSTDSGGSLVATTFADASGRLFWLVTIPPAIEPGNATLSADCGAEPAGVEFQIATDGVGEPQEEAA